MADYPDIKISFPFNPTPPEYPVAKTQMEQKYIQTRALTTVAPRRWSFNHINVTKAERLTWEAFWNEQHGVDGVFTWHDPEYDVDVNVRFNMEVPQIVWAGPRRYNITVELQEAL